MKRKRHSDDATNGNLATERVGGNGEPDDHSFSKGLSSPRKCSFCQKMVFFKAYRCKHCRYRCHKRCAGHSRRSSCQKSGAGEEHWTKVLQANEVNSNLVTVPCHGNHVLHQMYCEKTRQSQRSKSVREERDRGIFSQLYTRFCQWMASSRRDSFGKDCTSPHSPVSLTGPDIIDYDLGSPPSPSDRPIHKCHHPSISSEESELESSLLTSQSSTCSCLTLTSTSTACSERLKAWDQFTQAGKPATSLRNRNVLIGNANNLSKHSNLTSTESCPTKSVLSSTGANEDKNALCVTWPPTGRKHLEFDHLDNRTEEEEDLTESALEDSGEVDPSRSVMSRLQESLGECRIAFSALQFGDCHRIGRRHEIYRGRWHGEVMIHAFRDLNDEEISRFWNDVSKLSLVRHENVTLFMGACIDQPNFAVVTSVPKGVSLYDSLHTKSERSALHARVHIARQIAQAMGYLHAKGIVFRKLNSMNIYLEPKVKLCLMDYGMPEKKYDRSNYAYLPRGHLTYVAPEILCTLRVIPPRLEPQVPCTQETDIFAFGTVLYELVVGEYPFCGCSVESIIWQVSRGRRQTIKGNSTLKSLIERCWSQKPLKRPAFSEINKDLQQNGVLHKRHSCSEPERVNRTGMPSRSVFV